jgi:cell division protein FtsQ
MTIRKASPKAKAGQPRPRVKPIWRDAKVLVLAAIVAVGATTAGGWWMWKDGMITRAAQDLRWAAIAATAEVGFRVEDVLVVGRRETPREELLKAVRLARGAPILAFDPDAAKSRIEALPWVRAVSVQRRLPNTVFLRLIERRPLAVWQNDGRFSLIDYDGEVISNRSVDRFSNLLLVVGVDAPVHAAGLLEMLWHQPKLMARVKAAVRVGGRRWNVRLDNGIDVRLPEENPASAWARLAEYDRTHSVLEKDIGVLDLRQPDRLIVQKAGHGKQDPATEGTDA